MKDSNEDLDKSQIIYSSVIVGFIIFMVVTAIIFWKRNRIRHQTARDASNLSPSCPPPQDPPPYSLEDNILCDLKDTDVIRM